MSRIGIPTQVFIALGFAVGLATLGAGPVRGAFDVRIVGIMDQCDPASFNAAFGAGTCASSHPGVSFDTFLRVLGQTQSIGAWRFAPGDVRLQQGQAFQAVNRGGEVHTFTEVDEFGGGLVPPLNVLSGNPVPAPECLQHNLDDAIPPGGAGEVEVETPGTHHYQCCIHPWMRADVTVR